MPESYELIVERSFSAAHCLRGYQGDCARVHGHNYKVEVSVVGETLLPTGFVLDFGDLKTRLDDVLGVMDHRMLNDLPTFADCNPTAENIARVIYHSLVSVLEGTDTCMSFVRVWETPAQSCTYRVTA